MTPEQIHAIQRKHNPPDNEVPGAVPFAAVLGRNGDVAVAIAGVQAYSSGLSFNLAVRLRREDRDNPRALPDAVFGSRFGSGRTDDALLLGVAYPDGRTASTIGGGWPAADEADDRPVLTPGSGGGGSTSYDIRFWLNPLPSPGDLTIVCAWPTRGIAETRTVIEGDLIAAGIAAITELWPWEPDAAADEPGPPPRPAVPPGSWFAEHGPSDGPTGSS
jgi:hypothetical protein